MSESVTYQGARPSARDQPHTLFAQTMGYVAVTAGLFALGAYVGRHLSNGAGFVAFIVAFGCLIGMRFAARRRGAPDVATACLQRALAEPPPAAVRAEVLFGLGQLQAMRAPAAAVEHLSEALADTPVWPRRGEAALALGEALALGGRFGDAVELLASTAAEAPGERSREPLEAALLNTARMDIGTRAAARPLLAQILARSARGEKLDPQLHANLAIELAATGKERRRAIQHARQALTAIPRLMLVSTAALPETISVLLFADEAAEARAAASTWLQLAQQQGSEPAAATASGLMSLLALYGGEVSQAVAFGQQSIAGTPNIWISTITSSFVVRALVERGELAAARALLDTLGLAGDLPPTWPHNLERARRELVIAGGKPRRDATRGQDALTPSELRVAQLAAAAYTNRQIAQALFVTQRTVENHLTSTYAKLGISSRKGLATVLSQR